MVVHEVRDELAGHTLVIDPDIPGQIAWEALIAMAKLAKQVPPGGVVVETGSLFGRSAFVWAKNVHPSVTVYCIDPWVRERWIVDVVEAAQRPVMPFSIEAFRHYVRDCPNIRTVQGYSPEVIQRLRPPWAEQVDLFFDDGDHDEPGLSRNRDYWTPRVKPGGFFCADEYDSAYPDCLRKTHQLAIAWNAPVDRVGLFAWLRRPLRA